MKKEITKFVIAVVLLTMLPVENMKAQWHMYKRIELTSENLYTGVASIGIAALANVYAHYPLVDAGLGFSSVSSDIHLQNYADEPGKDADGQESSMAGYSKFDARHLFNHIGIGAKVGYISDMLGFINYVAYGSLHYNLRQLQYDDFTENHKIQRLQVGAGGMISLGNVEQKSRWVLDAGLRYNLPLSYSNSMGWGENDMLKSGLSSHYKFTWGYENRLAIGLYANIMHYDLFKDSYGAGKNKVHEFGLIIQILDDLF